MLWLHWSSVGMGVIFFLGLAAVASATSVRQQYGQYRDNLGQTSDRWQVDGNVDIQHQAAGLRSSNVSLSIARDFYRKPESSESRHAADEATLGYVASFNKLTDGRFVISSTRDQNTHSVTGGTGFSRWFYGESLQASVDISRTWLNRPAEQVVGYQFDIISPPPLVQSWGANVGVKHLATPRTVVKYSLAKMVNNERPDAEVYSFEVRHFFPALRGAGRVLASRYLNRGRIEQTTLYGQMHAWMAEMQWQQELWGLSSGKIRYRWYREDEVSPKDGANVVLGSDLVSLQLKHPVSVERSSQPTVFLEGGISRYVTNDIDDQGTRVSALAVELGMTAKL